MEAEKRVMDIDWSWAISKVNQAVNQQMTAIENDVTLETEVKKSKIYELEKAWQRILTG
ncbi:MAG: hypothetical protein ACO3OM_10815 [Alphaproteobacteria bacterium]